MLSWKLIFWGLVKECIILKLQFIGVGVYFYVHVLVSYSIDFKESK